MKRNSKAQGFFFYIGKINLLFYYYVIGIFDYGNGWSNMDKRTFKSKVLNLLEQEVIGLPSEMKIKYMKKWIRDFEIGKGEQKAAITQN